MCVNYVPPEHQGFVTRWRANFDGDGLWKAEIWQDYSAPIIRSVAGSRLASLGSYGLVPKAHMPQGVRLTTMNARSESVGQKPTYAKAWKAGQLCLVPMRAFFEPCWEGGTHVRWRIGMADESEFAVAGIWKEWPGADGATELAFSQLTINADQHELMKRFHKPGEEKRSVVIVPPDDYDEFLACRDSELARSFLRPYPPELMAAAAAPLPARKKTGASPAHESSMEP